MRRILLALLATTFGTALLVSLKVQVAPAQIVADAPLDPTGSAAPTTAAAPPPAPRPTTSGRAKPSATTRKPGPTATTTEPAAPTTRTIVGTAYPAVWQGENYGNMQVKIFVTGTHIDRVVAVQQSNRPRNVASVLGAKAVSAQSANVGSVSGATASSLAYRKSLQTAIDKI